MKTYAVGGFNKFEISDLNEQYQKDGLRFESDVKKKSAGLILKAGTVAFSTKTQNALLLGKPIFHEESVSDLASGTVVDPLSRIFLSTIKILPQTLIEENNGPKKRKIEADEDSSTIQPKESETLKPNKKQSTVESKIKKGCGLKAKRSSERESHQQLNSTKAKKKEKLQKAEIYNHNKKEANTNSHKQKTNHTSRKLKTNHACARHKALDFSNLRGKMIALDGLSGVGKSVLAKALLSLQQQIPGEILSLEGKLDHFQNLINSSPLTHHLFTLQYSCIMQQKHQLEHLVAHKDEDHFLLWDHSLLGDYAYILHTFLEGDLLPEELQFFESLLQGSFHTGSLKEIMGLAEVDIFVWLVDSPEAILSRGGQCLNNNYLQYLKYLDDITFSVMLHFLSQAEPPSMLVLPYEIFSQPNLVVERLSQLVDETIESPRVTFHVPPRKVPPVSSDSCVVYKSILEVDRKAPAIDFGGTNPQLPSRDVYLPLQQAQMQQPPIGLENIWQKDLVYHFRNVLILCSQQFKKLVYWHLHNGDHLFFY